MWKFYGNLIAISHAHHTSDIVDFYTYIVVNLFIESGRHMKTFSLLFFEIVAVNKKLKIYTLRKYFKAYKRRCIFHIFFTEITTTYV